jgi:hypothetical protein
MAVYADQELEANFCSWDYDGAVERKVVGGHAVRSSGEPAHLPENTVA